MSQDADIQHRRTFKAGAADFDAHRVANSIEPEIFFDDAVPNDRPSGLDGCELLDALVTEAKDCAEIGQRAVILSYLLQTPTAPKSWAELATRLDFKDYRTAQAKCRSVTQCLQEFLRDSMQVGPH